MADKGTRTPLKELAQRVAAGASYLMTGKPNDWFGPSIPPQPMAPPSVEGRQFDYPVAFNLQTSPRQGEAVGFNTLRALADSYDVLRSVIETRKDQLAKLDWTIVPREGKAKEDDPRAKELRDFFLSPDKNHDWDGWLRMLLEDLFVIDAPTVFVRKTLGGQVFAFEPIDGATIKPILDDWGRVPVAPNPAYMQVLKGVPAANYTRDRLIYRPRNVRTHKVYGYSPVEQIIMTVNIALRRQLGQLNYYEEGSVPDALAGVPESWTPKQTKEFQDYFDTLIASGHRRKLRFVPGEIAKNFKETKQPPLKDVYDEWLARVVCYVFSVEVTPFVAQVNRATAETNREQSVMEGLEPLKRYVKGFMDTLLLALDAQDYVFAWQEEESIAPKVQADIDEIYLRNQVVTVAEVRERLGLDSQNDGDDAGGDGGEGATTATGEGAAAAVTEVQQTALNGTQIASLREIVVAVGAKEFPYETGRAMLTAAFPAIDAAVLDSIMEPMKNFEPPPPDPDPLGLGIGGDEGAEDGDEPAELDDEGNPVPPKPKAKPKAKPGAKANDKTEKVEVHVHLPEQRAPDVFVDVAGTTVNATIEVPNQTITKTITASRDPATGGLIGKITTTNAGDEPLGKTDSLESGNE